MNLFVIIGLFLCLTSWLRELFLEVTILLLTDKHQQGDNDMVEDGIYKFTHPS